jgi:septal ring factor EnvC (AmiA/AmiB activator)
LSLPVGLFHLRSIHVAALAALGAGSFALALLAMPLSAQEDALPDPVDIPADDLERTAGDVQGDLEMVRGEINLGADRIEAIRAEIEALDGDATQLGVELTAAAQRVDLADTDIRQIEERLQALFAEEQTVRSRLDGHDRSISNLLASLQRISVSPPPAMIVDPADALGAARAALLLGAVLPQLQQRADTVTEDLNALLALKQTALEEADRLNANLMTLNEERLRIATIIEARQRGLEWLNEDLLREQAEAQALADRATSLEQLIESLDTRIAAVTAADEATRAANAGETIPTLDPETLALAFADTARTEPAVPVAAARGYLTAPVRGAPVTTYGAADGFGGTAKGLTVSTEEDAAVVAPADGWVVYTGPFLNYGQIVILNAGQDYLLVLAGLDTVSVERGAFVQMGTSVGTMGEAPGDEADGGGSGPALYIELREGGVPIDPEGWWAARTEQQESGTS